MIHEGAAPSDLALGGRFRRVRPLGGGLFTEAVLVQSVEGGRRGVLRTLRPSAVADDALRQRFLQAQRFQATLVHPQVVRVHEVDEDAEVGPYALLEPLDYASIGQAIPEGMLLPLPHAVSFAMDVAAALAVVHEKGGIHGLLAPSKVGLQKAPGGELRVKVRGFGEVPLVRSAGPLGQRSPLGFMVGRPGYLAPEILRGTEEPGASADLWSAAVLLYEWVTGRVCFPGPTDFARGRAVLRGPPPVLEGQDFGGVALGPLLARALSPEPGERFPTALDYLEALSSLSIGEPGSLPLLVEPSSTEPLLRSAVAIPVGQGPQGPRVLGSAVEEGGSAKAGPPVPSPVPSVSVGFLEGGGGAMGGRDGLPSGATLPSHGLPQLPAVDHGAPVLPPTTTAEPTGTVLPTPNRTPRGGWVWAFALGLVCGYVFAALTR